VGAALALAEESAGEEAVRQTVRFIVIEGGAATVEGEAAAGAATIGVEAAGGGAAIGFGGILLIAGVSVVAVAGLIGLGYYLYKKHEAATKRDLVSSCPKAASPATLLAPVVASSPGISASPAPYRNKDRKCGPNECNDAIETIRDLLKSGRTAKRSYRERLEQLRENKERQPYQYEKDPGTGEIPRSRGGTRSGHIDEIIVQNERGSKAIKTYYECGCTGLADSEIHELGDLLLADPLEGVSDDPPSYTTPAGRPPRP
jgi:hypothetical protein